jgi:hypothetical protein
MKRSFLVGLIVTFALTFSATTVFAATPEQQVKVYVDGSKTDFTVDPLIESGSTLVQFKPVFEKLGLTVEWNGETKTVTGSTYNLNIQLTIGSKTVIVNGQEKQLTIAPKIVKDVTMIPLRFVGEASGREVSWDARTKTVYIASTEEQLYHVIQSQIDATQSEDLEGVLATIDSSSTAYEPTKAAMKQIFAAYKLSYKLEKIELISLEKDMATVKIIQTTKKIEGPEFKDNQTTALGHFIKVKGEWKNSITEVMKIDFLNGDQFQTEKVTLSDEDQKQVLALIEKNRVSSEKEDFDGLKSVYDPTYPNLEQTIARSKQIGAAFDFKLSNENVVIIQGADGNAKVRYIQNVEKTKGPEFPNIKVEGVDTLKKNKDGVWKIIKSDIISQEFIR